MQKVKQSKRGNHIYPLSFKTYPKDTKFCGVAHLKKYIENSSDKLFISYTKPHQGISKDTLSRWCKTVMELSGIDIQKYCTHSTTTIGKIFETSSSFHVKYRTKGKFLFLFSSSFLLVLTKFKFWEVRWALGYNSMKF